MHNKIIIDNKKEDTFIELRIVLASRRESVNVPPWCKHGRLMLHHSMSYTTLYLVDEGHRT